MERKAVPSTDVGDVTGASSKIPVNIEVANDRSHSQINDHRQYVTNIRGIMVPITTAIFRNNPRVSLLAGWAAVIGYGVYKMGYKAGPFSKGSITFDITTEPDKERTVRRRLENGTFLKELQEEVKDIIEEHSDILGDLKDFTIISCEEILPNKEKEGYGEVKDVELEDSPSISQGINIVQGVEEILPNKEKEGDDEVKNVEVKDLPSVPQGIVQGVGEILPNKEKEGYDEVKKVGMKHLPPVPQGIVQGVGVDVGGEVSSSTIRVKLKSFGLPSREINKRGRVDISLELCKHAIIAALSRQFHVFKTGEEASIGFAIEQLGYIVDKPYSKCCITFDITIDSDKESRVRDILESGTFRHKLKKEVYMLKEHPWGLLDFTGISCKKIHTKAEKGIYIIQTAEGKIEALVQETRQLRMLMLSLKEKFDGVDETKQSSKDQEPDTETPKSFDVQPTRADTVKVTTGPEPPSADF